MIGSRVRQLRMRNKMTQENLEEKSGVSTRQISDIECGRCDCKITTLMKIINALDMSVYDFFKTEIIDITEVKL